MPLFEPGLEELVSESVRQGRLRFSTELSEAVKEDVLFIAVGTPQGEDGAADLSSVGEVARGVGRVLAEAPPKAQRTRPLVVVNKSTVPVGSGDYVSMLIQEGAAESGAEGVSSGGDGGSGVSYRVVSNPEFLREGSAVYDTLFPDRIRGPRRRCRS
jgi:UDPglucose 6-dehydrogenase